MPPGVEMATLLESLRVYECAAHGNRLSSHSQEVNMNFSPESVRAAVALAALDRSLHAAHSLAGLATALLSTAPEDNAFSFVEPIVGVRFLITLSQFLDSLGFFSLVGL